MITRFDNVDSLFEAIEGAYKRSKKTRIYIPKEIAGAINKSKESQYSMKTRKVKGDCENYLLLSFKIPGQEEIEFDVELAQIEYYFVVDFSKETDYCGMY